MKIYEIVDATSDECYYPVGIFLTLQDAVSSVENLPPDEWNHSGYIDVCGTLEIRERQTGLHGDMGKTVYTVEWIKAYNEETDENEWVKE